MKEYYGARANEYDRIYAKPERQADLRQLQIWLPTLFAGRSVLEIACGTGYWTQFYAPMAERVVALDAARETLRIAAERVDTNTVHLRHGDAYGLPAFDALFDAAFAGFWWSHIPQERIAEFLVGLHLALEPGARIVFLDNRFVPGSSTPIADQDSAGNTYQMRTLDDGSMHRILKNFPTRDQLLATVDPYAESSTYFEWEYFWALEYTLKSD
ncbi:class I SAM-dependent methyltransferase [Advenella mimigardefordensis]|uniref:Putative methyltransferase n=1 Tax=Advenella mimigardefordensis (strain DSM 17166 / LMG 22922 / DPN7) TaxID=1247726 RepID=W0PGK2_ADVMD|nr:class I SAM-dependent methyltransferase [Advenella mimigardefordensis]AHG64330.1 putative methyltransferase [Advenella mimigardefordensis DPN7]